MENTPKVSIIIPIYNAEQHLRKCLESIKEQSYKDFEAILVDDGSTDKSADICSEYVRHDNRFSYVCKENGGVSSARNLGISKARGTWMSFIDADDWVVKEYLQVLMSQQNVADITFFGEITIKENREINRISLRPKFCSDRKDIEQAIYELKCGDYGDVFGWTWDKIFRADIIRENNVRFSENISFREDEIFTFEYCRYITSLNIIDDILYFYRAGNNGLTSQGLLKTDLLPSSIKLEESLNYYSHPALREHMLRSITDYRAMHIYAHPMKDILENLKEYKALTIRHPQPGIECGINHLTQYLNKSFGLGYLYCLNRIYSKKLLDF